MEKTEAEQLFNEAGRAVLRTILSGPAIDDEGNPRTRAWLASVVRVHQGTIDGVFRKNYTFSRVLLIRLAVAVDISPVALLALTEPAKTAIKEMTS